VSILPLYDLRWAIREFTLLSVVTLKVVAGLVVWITALALLVIHRMNRALPGPGWWSGGLLCSALAMQLTAWHDSPLAPIDIFVFNTGLYASLCLRIAGFQRFIGRPVAILGPSLLSAAAVALAVFWFTGAALPQRALVYALVTAVLSGRIVGLLMGGARRPSAPYRVVAGIYGLNGLVPLVIAWRIWQRSPLPLNALADMPEIAAFYLWGIVFSLSGCLGKVIMVFERLQEELANQASHDSLTGLLNRRAFEALAGKMVIRQRRRAGSLGLMIMDLDHFKLVNDNFGHAAGDSALTEFGRLARQVLRESDLFARYGGEEFVALLHDCDRDGAEATAERLRRRLAETTLETPAGPVALTVSIGLAFSEDANVDLSDLLRRADAALYQAKDAGRNCLAWAAA
jgi:diguanylate cyclase (GGDEF)-like protein